MNLLMLDMTLFISGELTENVLFTLADFKVKKLFDIGFAKLIEALITKLMKPNINLAIP